MSRRPRRSGFLLVVLNVVALSVLALYGTSAAAPREAPQPFANAVEQRFEIIRELKQLNALVKEQNELLRGLTKGAGQPQTRR